jgi:hypothetical protein
MRKGHLLGLVSWVGMPMAHAATTTLKAQMDGKQETGGGDPDGTGTAVFTLDDSKPDMVCYKITYRDIGKVTAAHIHAGAVGKSGSPVVTLDINKLADGCTKSDAATVSKIRDDPPSYYVNIHTDEYGNGAIRGQLAKG